MRFYNWCTIFLCIMRKIYAFIIYCDVWPTAYGSLLFSMSVTKECSRITKIYIFGFYSPIFLFFIFFSFLLFFSQKHSFLFAGDCLITWEILSRRSESWRSYCLKLCVRCKAIKTDREVWVHGNLLTCRHNNNSPNSNGKKKTTELQSIINR